MLRRGIFVARSELKRPFLNHFMGRARQFCQIANTVDEETPDTWSNQDSLPILPLPEVKDTCDRYRGLLKPLVTLEEFKAADIDITKFENSSIAEDLQSQLLELQSTESSWIEGFWDDMYLDIRDPLPINVNPYFGLASKWQGKQPNDTAARLVSAFSKFNKVLKDRRLVPDMEGKTPLCMFQYSKLFGYSRYPREKKDVFSSNRYARHIIVMRRGEMFTLVIENEKRQLLPVNFIRKQLDDICAIADNVVDTKEIGFFTCSNREVWAKNYADLEKESERNEKNLDLIHGSLMVLNLDEEDFDSLEIETKSLLHNRGVNRWFDKLQMIVAPDGSVGFNMEHTPIDGHTLVRLASDIHTELSDGTPYHEVATAVETDDIPDPVHLIWDVNDDIRERLQEAKAEFADFSDKTESIPIVDCMGKRLMKKCNTSPDAFVQMAIQLAYYREYGTFVSTYESAMTKQFLHGRTETIRSVSEESKHYCKNFDPSKPKESAALLVEACKKQSTIAKLAKNGCGVDRHLFGLKRVAALEKENNDNYQIPALFTSPQYATFGSNVISTSNCGAGGVGLFGFGAVHPDGVGIGYLIKDDETRLTVTASNGKAASFAKTLSETLVMQATVARTE